MADDLLETDQIERDLEQTRARMDRRLDELGERLAPNQLVNDALSHVSGSSGAQFTTTLIDKAKANPVPAALVGIGITWLLLSSQNKSKGTSEHADRQDLVRGQALGVVREASDTASSYALRVKDAVAAATQNAREASHDLGGGMSRAVGAAKSPDGALLVKGAIATLAGVIAGALIPLTSQERRTLGGAAEQLRSKGHDLADELVDRGTKVAGDALNAAKESAQARGLTGDRPVGELLSDIKSGELLRNVKQTAMEVMDAGKESLQT